MKYLRLILALLAVNSVFLLVSPAAAAPEGRKVSIEFRGPLNEALKQIASKGSINLVITGSLDQPAEVYFKNVTPEEALQTVAKVHHLRIEQQGSIWIVQPETAAERREQDATSPTPPAPEAKPAPAKPQEKREEQLSPKEARKITKDLKRKYSHGDQLHRGDLVISEGESAREAVVYGGNLTIKGETEGDAVAFGGNVEVTGHVGGNAVSIGGGVHLGPEAVVDGDATAIGGRVTKEEGAEVHGNQASVGSGRGIQIPSVKMPRIGPIVIGPRDSAEVHPRGHGILIFLVVFAASFALAFLCLLLFPERMKHIQSEVRAEPLMCLLIGFVAVIAGSFALVAVSVLLVVTIIGIIFLVPLYALLALAMMMGIAAVANELGSRLPWFKLRRTQAGVLAIGILLMMLVSIVPIMGPMIILLLSMIAIGAIVRTRFGQRTTPLLAQPV